MDVFWVREGGGERGRENVCGYAMYIHVHMWQRCKGCLLKELRSVCLSLCVDVFWVREGGGERGRENVCGYACYVMYTYVHTIHGRDTLGVSLSVTCVDVFCVREGGEERGREKRCIGRVAEHRLPMFLSEHECGA